MIKTILHHLSNIPGWRTNRKIVVFESDDWGSIRMPSKAVLKKLQNKGYKPENDPYLKYDSLASEDDLQNLFEILSSVKDKNGNMAVLTANCVVANPDFNKIQEHGFQEYFYEPFTDTLKRYPNHQNSFQLWQEGIKNRLFIPQFHGREHLNVYQWMNDLRKGDELLREAFNNEMISISSIPSKMTFGYMESLDYFEEAEKNTKNPGLFEGLDLFEKIFGYRSKSFIANCYIWSSSIEPFLKEQGIFYLQGIINQLEPRLNDNVHSYAYKKHFTGFKNKYGQRYLVRNAFFEPSLDNSTDWVYDCLSRISIAFKLKKPAIIASHRLNYIGYIHNKNSHRNLFLLKHLLSEIVKRWPDVEFMTSDELGDLIAKPV